MTDPVNKQTQIKIPFILSHFANNARAERGKTSHNYVIEALIG